MSADWREFHLGDLFRVKHGFAFKGEYFSETPQKYVLVTPGNFAIGGGFQRVKSKFYDGPIPDEYILKAGQIVVTMTDLSKQSDTLGYAGIVPNDGTVWLHNQRVGLLEFHKEVETDPTFVSYLLRTHEYRSWVVGSSTGTTVKHTSPGRIEAFKCRIPDIKSQREIAQTLQRFDDKIELNRQTNQTLEQIAQALFKSWFVDFEPTRAKIAAKEAGASPEEIERAAMCAISGKTPDQLAQLPPETQQNLKTTAALFPDALVDSELGEVPMGWSVGRIGDIAIAKGGYAFKSNAFIPTGNPVVKIKNIVGDGCVELNDSDCIDELEAKKAARFKLNDGDLIMAMTGATVGKTGLVVTNGLSVYLNQRVAKFESELFGPKISWFLFCCFQRDLIFDLVVGAAHGSAQPNISSAGIESTQLILPGEKLIRVFCEATNSFFEKWMSNISENSVMEDLRNELLPKLLNGELSLVDDGSIDVSE